MSKLDLISKIKDANVKYRAGDPIMEDHEYDLLIDELRTMVDNLEFEDIMSTLNEGEIERNDTRVKVTHPFILGSLEKLKHEQPQTLKKFISTYVKNKLCVSAKVDGISCRLHYENGKLISASTRGDGYVGIDITDKIRYVKFIPSTFGNNTVDIRGELVILKDDFATMSGYANPRNACAGIFNRKDSSIDELSKISFVAYTILGNEYTKSEQFEILSKDFKTAWNTELNTSVIEDNGEDISDVLFELANQEYEYEVDGLVISDISYRNEEKYRPDACMAYKINMLAVQTRLIDVIWQGPQKNGRFNPVGILEPVELGGSVIGKASIHNNDIIRKKGLKYGSIIQIIKSGDIIPTVTKVISNDDNTSDIEFPTVCPSCGETLVETEKFMVCPNTNCKDQTTFKTQYFLEKLGIENVSFKRLQQLGIFTIEDLISFYPNEKYKIETKLYDDMKSKMFTASRKDLLMATDFEGISTKILNKIFDFYGFENAIRHTNLIGLPIGVGEKIMSKFLSHVDENMVLVEKITNDNRYSYVETSQIEHRLSATALLGSICFTGSLSTMGRKEATNLAERNGYEVKNSVTKGLTYLVTSDPNSNSTKSKKAREFGTTVISETEFLNIMNSNGMNVDDL